VGCTFEDLSEDQRRELNDLIKSAQETQRELKREEMLKKGEINFDIDMLFL
jgi:7,8-dihydro-6-hydroxymethylpterin-pyrophosphokinase